MASTGRSQPILKNAPVTGSVKNPDALLRLGTCATSIHYSWRVWTPIISASTFLPRLQGWVQSISQKWVSTVFATHPARLDAKPSADKGTNADEPAAIDSSLAAESSDDEEKK